MYLFTRNGQPTGPMQLAVQRAVQFCIAEWDDVKNWLSIRTARSKSTAPATVGGKGPLSGPLKTIQRVVASVLAAGYELLTKLGMCGTNTKPPRWCKLLRDQVVRRAAGQRLVKRERQAEIDRTSQKWSEREASFTNRAKVPRLAVRSEAEGRQFIREFMEKNQPAILSNFQSQWTLINSAAVGAEAEAQEWLPKELNSAIVRVSVSESGRFDGPEPAELWGLGSQSADVLVRPPATYMFLHHFFELLQDASVSETFYLEYLALHQYLGAPVTDRIPMPAWLQASLKSSHSAGSTGDNSDTLLDHLVTNIWIGGRPTTSPLHYDDYENFLCQIVGEKELLLFPPSDLPFLYYEGRPKGVLQYSFPGNFTRTKSSVDSRGVVFGSSVNVDEPDFDRHPLYKRAKAIRVVLAPGDTLYLPAFWHHEVQSRPSDMFGGGDRKSMKLNIAVNFWFANLTAPVDEKAILGV
mmetsp:Transcript_6162/g.9203  ORF Transcript_6162/g.9203 Transcript_6162/m.9203 type:complete len:466 (+) Transcript_6162:116-1513(+)